MFRFSSPRDWPELVFHVLAHVRLTAHLPASAYDAVYVDFVTAHAGRAEERPLGEDIDVLARALANHDALARAQLVARLFDSAEDALAQSTTDLGDLASVSPGLREALRPVATGVEILRCAALLEKEAFDSLPPPALDESTLSHALEQVLPASPTLVEHVFVPVRALRLRGRLFQREIWHGIPSQELALTNSHVAWQAAHEATVGEVSRVSTLAERDVEHVAVVLLSERAEECGLAEPHAAWLSHFGELPDTRRASLAGAALKALVALRSSDGSA